MRRPYGVLLSVLLLACSSDEPAPQVDGRAFGGLAFVAPDRSGRLVVGWRKEAGATEYRVYASLLSGRPLRNAPVAIATESPIVIAPTTSGERHFFVVRAVDAAGKEDDNVVEKSAVAVSDTTPPRFGGVKSATSLADSGATLTWDAATDDLSPPEAITYDIYAGRTAETLVPIATSAPGETSAAVTGLGSPAEPFVFAVAARDVGDNVSPRGAVLSAPLGADSKAPAFGGCQEVNEVGSRSVAVHWQPATDDHARPEDVQYEVYASKTSATHDFAAPPIAKVKGGSFAEVRGLDPSSAYFFVCRARDASGNAESNVVEKSVTTADDVVPPTFAGLTDALVDSVARTVLLSWKPATDDRTAPSAIVYDVYETQSSGAYDPAARPRASSAPGATSVLLTDLEPRSTLHWIVRARDEAYNRDDNTREKSGDVKTSFSQNVLPIFVHACAVVGCHVSGAQAAGLNLAPGFAYQATVGKPAVLAPAKQLVSLNASDPLGNSFLYEKITSRTPSRGASMPAPQTGNSLSSFEKDVITSWILDGAPNN